MIELTFLLFCFSSVLGLSVSLDEGNADDEKQQVLMFYPAAIDLGYYDTDSYHHICGGVLIDNYTVITATHCDVGQTIRKAIYGSDFYGQGTEHEIDIFVGHPQYDSHENHPSNGYDIAVIKLKTPVTLLGSATFPKLRTTQTEGDEKCFEFGWGVKKSSKDDPRSEERKLAIVHSHSDLYTSSGKRAEPGFVYTSQNEDEINQVGSYPTCRGNSGGPLICEGQLTGVEAFRARWCGIGKTIAFTELRYYKTWIEETVQQLENRS